VPVVAALLAGCAAAVAVQSFMGIETLLCLALGLLIVAPLAWRWATGRFDVMEPMVLVAAIYMLYFVVAPLVRFWMDDMTFLQRNFQSEYGRGLLAVAVVVASMWTGYALPVGPRPAPGARLAEPARALPPAEAAAARRLGWRLVALALLAMVAWARVAGRTLWTFFLPGVFGGIDAGGGTDVAYLFLAIEWFMPAFMVLVAAGAMRSRWRALTILVLVSVVYVSIGFRYRLVVLWLAAGMLVYLRAGKRPSLATLLPGAAVAFGVVGWVGWARTYFRSAGAVGGLTTDRRRLLLGALSDTRIFETFTAVLELVPNYVRFAHFKPLLYIFILPFPRFLWHGKPMPTWLDDVRTSIGTPYSESAGAAVPHFGEYYMAFGWPGLVIGSLLFGMAVKLLWRWYRADPGDPWRQAIFSLNTAFLFVAVIRGYAAQIVQEWCFIVLPAVVLVWLARRSGRRHAAAQAHA
jgi:hypothetical protein